MKVKLVALYIALWCFGLVMDHRFSQHKIILIPALVIGLGAAMFLSPEDIPVSFSQTDDDEDRETYGHFLFYIFLSALGFAFIYAMYALAPAILRYIPV